MHNHGYRGRVRTGCLTCRARKVRCDEGRPACRNCTRLDRGCVYAARPRRPVIAPASSSSRSPDTTNSSINDAPTKSQGPSPGVNSFARSTSRQSVVLTATPHHVPPAPDGPFSYPDSAIKDVTARLQRTLERRRGAPHTPDDAAEDENSPASLISRDIELTTTMDILAAAGESSQLTCFFLETVDCPGITPFDAVNWATAKHCIVDLGSSCTTVVSGINAVATLFMAHTYGLPDTRAMSLYHSTRSALEQLLADHALDFEYCLVVMFLLCLFDLVYADEVMSAFKEPSDLFLTRLGAWVKDGHRSDLSKRLLAWINIMQTMTSRGGGLGFLSESICSLLPNHDGPLPTLVPPTGPIPDAPSDLPTHLYEMLCGPAFDFYCRLQAISGDIARLTHYHRSRNTGGDQAEVVRSMAGIKDRLRALWDNRPATMRQSPGALREQLTPDLAAAVIALIGLCAAAYHAEFVEIDRVLGDPLEKWTDSRESIRAIREIVESQSVDCETTGVNPGFLRPLFLFAIECMDRDQSQWAADRIAQIRDPIYRGKFFSAFAVGLSDAQIRKERRVTSKYFSIWSFGGPPPYLRRARPLSSNRVIGLGV